MSGGWPITNYHIWQAKKALKALVSLSVIAIIAGNIAAAIFISKVRVDSSAYRLREGFPIFTAHEAYIQFIRSYPHNPGVEIILHTMRMNESYWDVPRVLVGVPETTQVMPEIWPSSPRFLSSTFRSPRMITSSSRRPSGSSSATTSGSNSMAAGWRGSRSRPC